MGMLSKMKSNNAPAAPAQVVAAVAEKVQTPAPAEAPKRSLIIDQSTTPDAELRANPNRGQPVAQVLPPDAPKPQAQPASVVQAAPATPAQAAPEPIYATSAEQPAKAMRARKQKAETTEKTAPATSATTSATSPAVGFSLYIGCAPKKAAVSSLMPYVDALEKTALEGFKANLKDAQGNPLMIDDIRLSVGSEVGFGKWKAVLQALAKEAPPAPGAYSVLALGMDERVDTVVAALEGLAAEVVTR